MWAWVRCSARCSVPRGTWVGAETVGAAVAGRGVRSWAAARVCNGPGDEGGSGPAGDWCRADRPAVAARCSWRRGDPGRGRGRCRRAVHGSAWARSCRAAGDGPRPARLCPVAVGPAPAPLVAADAGSC